MICQNNHTQHLIMKLRLLLIATLAMADMLEIHSQETANTDADGAKYSVSGIRMDGNTPLPRGIYIQAGKKRVAGR